MCTAWYFYCLAGWPQATHPVPRHEESRVRTLMANTLLE